MPDSERLCRIFLRQYSMLVQ